MLQCLFPKRPARIFIILSIFLLLISLNSLSVFSQEPSPSEEPSPVSPEIPTELPSATPVSPTETATATFTELPSPTATNTELPSPTATETLTETLVAPTETPTETIVETETETATLTATPTTTITETLSPTPTLTPSAVVPANSSRIPTPGAPDYAAMLQQAQAQGNQAQLLDECSTDITEESATVAPPNSGTHATDFYTAIAQAHDPGSASPYPIYLCPGNFPLDETLPLFVDIIISGQGMDVSTIYQAQQNVDAMGGMFTLNGNLLEFHNLTVKKGRALSLTYGATVGGAIKIWSGTLNIYDSKFEDNQAYDGGAIGWGDDITIERSVFVNNSAQTTGGALYVDDVSASCSRFIANRSLDTGGAINVGGDGPITDSSFVGNRANNEGNAIYSEVSTDATSNWWDDTTPQVPDDVSSGVDTSSPQSSDPTSGCGVSDPKVQACDVLTPHAAVKLRKQPSLDDENWLFEVPDTYVYSDDSELSSLPNRPWLWPSGSVSDPVTIVSIRAIAYVGVIGWVDPDIDWIQVQVTTNEAGDLFGYMERTDVDQNKVLSLYSCDILSLSRPANDANLPIVTPATFVAPVATNVIPNIMSSFGSGSNPAGDEQLPPSRMGSFGLHYGPIPATPGTTLDIVPANNELCIDTRSSLVQCDPGWSPPPTPNPNPLNPDPARVPVYAPVSGCATFTDVNDESTLIISIDRVDTNGQPDCSDPTTTGDREVVLTHVRNLLGTSQRTVTSGEIVAELCLHSERRTECGIDISVDLNTPTHVAFQLRTWSSSIPTNGNLGTASDIYREVIGVLAIPYCLYDEWNFNQGGTPTPPATPYAACP